MKRRGFECTRSQSPFFPISPIFCPGSRRFPLSVFSRLVKRKREGGGRRYRSSSQKKKKKGGNFSFSCLPINNSCKRAQFRLKSRRQEEEEVGQREIDLSSPCRASFSLCRVQESRAENIDFGQCGEQHKSKKRREERTMDELFPDFCIHAAHSLCCLLLLPSLEKSERNKKSNWTTSFFLSSLFSCRLFFILKAKSFTPIRTGRLNSFRLYTFFASAFRARRKRVKSIYCYGAPPRYIEQRYTIAAAAVAVT